MIEDHLHGPDGRIVVSEPALADSDVAEAAEVETVADAEVEIAKINADRDVQIARTDAKRAETYATEEMAEMRGELRALREIVDALKPPEPEPPAPPVVVEAEPAEPELDAPPPPETDNTPADTKKRARHLWFG